MLKLVLSLMKMSAREMSWNIKMMFGISRSRQMEPKFSLDMVAKMLLCGTLTIKWSKWISNPAQDLAETKLLSITPGHQMEITMLLDGKRMLSFTIPRLIKFTPSWHYHGTHSTWNFPLKEIRLLLELNPTVILLTWTLKQSFINSSALVLTIGLHLSSIQSGSAVIPSSEDSKAKSESGMYDQKTINKVYKILK